MMTAGSFLASFCAFARSASMSCCRSRSTAAHDPPRRDRGAARAAGAAGRRRAALADAAGDVRRASASFIDQSIASVGAGMKGAGDTMGDHQRRRRLAKGVADAAGAVARLPLTNVVSGFELCASRRTARRTARRRASRCARARATRPENLDITSSRKCPPPLARGAPADRCRQRGMRLARDLS